MSTGAPKDWFPVDRREHAAQVAALLGLTAIGDRVVDLGAGDGRIARALHEAGREVLAIDNDPRAVEACAAAGLDARLADFLDESAWDEIARFKPAGICCLGNTFMVVADPDAAAELMRRALRGVRPGGFLAIDALCEAPWRDVAEGNWQEGISEDGSMQLVWARGGQRDRAADGGIDRSGCMGCAGVGPGAASVDAGGAAPAGDRLGLGGSVCAG